MKRRQQQGLSLVAAIFVLTLLATLLAYMGGISAGQHVGSALSLQTARAEFAARSGLDWAVWYLRSNHTCPPNNTAFDVEQFRVRVSDCAAVAVSEGGDSYQVFDITVQAQSRGLSFGEPGYAARSLRASLIGG
jgi:Tfp pilus assembly protein PilX